MCVGYKGINVITEEVDSHWGEKHPISYSVTMQGILQWSDEAGRPSPEALH